MPYRIGLGAGAGIVALLLATQAYAVGPVLQRGHDILERTCAACHAVGAHGESRNAAAPRFRDLHDRYPVEMLAEALAEGILTDHPAMPQFQFQPGEIDAIIAYLQSIQTRGAAGAPVGIRATPGTRRFGAG